MCWQASVYLSVGHTYLYHVMGMGFVYSCISNSTWPRTVCIFLVLPLGFLWGHVWVSGRVCLGVCLGICVITTGSEESSSEVHRNMHRLL